MTLNPYHRLGVRRVINAAGILTRVGGSRSPSDIFSVMEEASKAFVIISELQTAAGKVIARATGAEAGLPTAGGSASILLAAAACIMKDTKLEEFEPIGQAVWRKIAQRLPLNTNGLKTEFIVQKCNRDEYDHAVECAGGRFIEVGTDEFATEGELIVAFNPEKTAAYYYTVKATTKGLPLTSIIKVAHEKGVPVVVDACAEPPPKSSLTKYIEMGVDLVAFSGGKIIAGPNNSGLLAGRKDLIKLAHLQSYPFEGVGRAAKMSRETIYGLVTALELYLKSDEMTQYNEYKEMANRISCELNCIPGIKAWVDIAVSGLEKTPRYPLTCVSSNMDVYGISTKELHDKLIDTDPRIVTVYEPYYLIEKFHGVFVIIPLFLDNSEVNIIINKIKEFSKR
jgi:L-seryl-tRNA(Ser) seleniumtransferase